MKILVLDYDGVLVDSAKESFAVAFNLYIRQHGFKHNINEPLSYRNFHRIDNELKDLEANFNKLRAYCDISCSFLSVLAALDRQKIINNKKEFENFINKTQDYPKMGILFHKERERLINENFDAFLKLTPAHKEIVDGVKRLFNLETEVFIASKNKKELLIKVLDANGFKIPEEHIYDAYRADNKKEAVQKIIEELELKYNNVMFIDDNLKYLIPIAKMGVKTFLAEWGFVTQEDIEEAERQGIEVLSKQVFYQKIREELNQ